MAELIGVVGGDGVDAGIDGGLHGLRGVGGPDPDMAAEGVDFANRFGGGEGVFEVEDGCAERTGAGKHLAGVFEGVVFDDVFGEEQRGVEGGLGFMGESEGFGGEG